MLIIIGLQNQTNNVVAAHGVHLHQYGDDTQFYVALRSSDVSPLDVVSHSVQWRSMNCADWAKHKGPVVRGAVHRGPIPLPLLAAKGPML